MSPPATSGWVGRMRKGVKIHVRAGRTLTWTSRDEMLQPNLLKSLLKKPALSMHQVADAKKKNCSGSLCAGSSVPLVDPARAACAGSSVPLADPARAARPQPHIEPRTPMPTLHA